MNNEDREWQHKELMQRQAKPKRDISVNEYSVITSCNKCGGKNSYNVKSVDGYTTCEAETHCTICDFQDYWAYGTFESGKDGFNASQKYTTQGNQI